MIKFQEILRQNCRTTNQSLNEMVSKSDLLGIYQKMYPQLSLPFSEHDAESHLKSLIRAYALAIGKGKRGELNHLISTESDLKAIWDLIHQTIKEEYGSSNIKLYRGISVNHYNGEINKLTVGDSVELGAWTSGLSGWTDDESIATSFANMGSGLPQGMRRDDAELGDFVEPDTTVGWEDMLGYVFEATIPVEKIFFAPKLLENEFFEELFLHASTMSNATIYELKSEAEFIVQMPVSANVEAGYFFERYEDDFGVGEEGWSWSDNPKEDREEFYRLQAAEDDDEY